jgi:hypothetical protein
VQLRDLTSRRRHEYKQTVIAVKLLRGEMVTTVQADVNVFKFEDEMLGTDEEADIRIISEKSSGK